MAISYSLSVEMQCPECAQAFGAEIWLIVDANERPDLNERVCNGSIHEGICPHCGILLSLNDVPLLLNRPGETPSLVFSPAERSDPDPDQVQAQAASVVRLLRDRLDASALEDLVSQGVVVVPRDVLPTIFDV